MSLNAGKKLGPYEILAGIGSGGMGEVYRAKDTRLNRLVAIKVLSERGSSNPELKQRFEREARTLASLSHPHICPVFDVGQQDGVHYLVMEFLEGQTLQQRLEKGALPFDEALKYTIQAADALDRAHRLGVTHRDVKPSNIMLTSSGVKLLDFGLAKLREPLLEFDGTALTVADHSITAQGTILGTLQYMAPEQLEGKATDGRTDVFALGAVLYEMLTGKKAFEAKSSASLVAAILEHTPPSVSASQSLASPLLDHVVGTCMAKDPEERWQSAREVIRELEWVTTESSKLPSAKIAARKWSIYQKAILWVSIAAISAIAILNVMRFFPGRPSETTAIRFTMSAPENASFLGGTTEPFAEMSPNGRQVVFRALANGGKFSTLWIHTLESQATVSVPGSEDGALPFWSPDGRYIGFFAQGKLKKIEAGGGASETVCDVPARPLGATWNGAGTILFATEEGLFRVAADGTQPISLQLGESKKTRAYRWPRFLPDGQRFLYIGGPPPFAAYLASMQSAEPKRLFEAESKVVYAEPGFLLFTRQGTLTAQAFDLDRGELVGNPISLIQGIRTGGATAGSGPNGATAAFSVSDTGILSYRTGAAPKFSMALYDRNGKGGMPLADPAFFQGVALSPDGRNVAYHIHESPLGGDIWVLDLMRGAIRRFTFSPADHNSAPLWSVDGTEIIYSADRGNESVLLRKAANGAGREEVLIQSKNMKDPTSVSPDGSLLMYEESDPKTKFDIWVVPLKGGGKPTPIIQTEFNEWRGQFSPDGRWIAYASDESGRNDIYVQPYPPNGAKWLISTNGGDLPKWNSTGKEIFYIGPNRKLMVVATKPVRTGLDFSPPQSLFETNATTGAAHVPFDVAQAGHQFLMTNRPGEDNGPTPVTFVINWTALLKK